MRTSGSLHVVLLVKVILAVPVRTSEKQEVHRRPNEVHVASFRNAAAKVPRRQSHSQSVESVLELTHVAPHFPHSPEGNKQAMPSSTRSIVVQPHRSAQQQSEHNGQDVRKRPDEVHVAALQKAEAKEVASGRSHLRSVNSFLDVKHVGVANTTVASHQVLTNSTLASRQKSIPESIGNRSNDVKNVASDKVASDKVSSPLPHSHSRQGNNQTMPSSPSTIVVQPHGLAQQQSEHNRTEMGALRTPTPEGRLGALARIASDLEQLIISRTGFATMLLWATLTALVGLFYHKEKAHPPRLDPEGVNVSLHDRDRLNRRRWRFGLLEFCGAPSLCCFSFFCAPIRWADTMRMAGFLNFFSALGLVIALTVIGFLTFGMGFCLLLFVMVLYRQRLQEKFNIRSNTAKEWLSFVFCPWCSIAQEARQVEEAYLARHPAVRAQQAPKRFAFGKDCSVIKA